MKNSLIKSNVSTLAKHKEKTNLVFSSYQVAEHQQLLYFYTSSKPYSSTIASYKWILLLEDKEIRIFKIRNNSC